ncbi:MAG TPA: class I SAM-dependent methyltransferase, partial [Sumerlaeia bacterium]|nr:class I SAM-dependent methyltransferase [Sumerlaeia bacterium]
GTGTGRCRLGLLDCGYRDVWGCDISQPVLAKQRHWEKELGKPCDGGLVCCKADSLGFADDSFDCVVLVSTLHHIPNVSKFLAEAARVLREGGRLVILEEPSENALETFDKRFDRNARVDLKTVFESFIHGHLVRSESITRLAELYDGVGFSRDFLTRHLENASFEVRRIYQASFFSRLWSQALQPLAKKGDLANEAGRLCTAADVLLRQILKEEDIERLFFDTNAIAVNRSKSRGRTHGDAEGSAVSADDPLCRPAG